MIDSCCSMAPVPFEISFEPVTPPLSCLVTAKLSPFDPLSCTNAGLLKLVISDLSEKMPIFCNLHSQKLMSVI